jgi:hypothetical protein
MQEQQNMSKNIESVTPLYDFLEGMIDSPRTIETYKKTEYDEIIGDQKLNKEEKAERLKKLKKLEEALAALKAKPGEAEANGELENYVKALIPFAANSLQSKDTEIKKKAIDNIKPLFEMFRDIYVEKYSEKTLKELRDAGKISLDQEKEFSEHRESLKVLCNKKPLDIQDIQYMHNFLKEFDKHPELLSPMVEALAKYRRENMNNFERALDNFSNSALQTLTNQSVHADYLQAWERVGYMSTNLARATVDMVTITLSGQTIPLNEPGQAPNNANPVITDPTGKPRVDVRNKQQP